VTVARGSSDHAASYVAYLIMARMGRLVTSLPMSLVTLYKSPLVTRDTLAIAISQSGQSPDVVEPIRYFRDGGATTWRSSTTSDSPLAQAAEWALPLHAGKETERGRDQELHHQPGGRRAPGGRMAGRPELLAGLAALPDALRAPPRPTGRPPSRCWRRPATSWWSAAASASRSRWNRR
jgi:glucosamine--fructose-6-phosphate aminotransferase (isomerizing)